jgi:hypothetical protein
MCKWNAFTIDRKRGVCKDGLALGKIFSTGKRLMENHEHPSPDILG